MMFRRHLLAAAVPFAALPAFAEARPKVVATFSILGNTQNVKSATAPTPLFANTTVNSVTLNSGGGFSSGIIAGNPWNASGGLLTLSNTSTGVLNQTGSNAISVGAFAYGGVTADIHVLAGSTGRGCGETVSDSDGRGACRSAGRARQG